MGTWEFYLDFKQSAVGNFIAFRGNRQLGILLGFQTIGDWEFHLDFGQSAIGNADGIRAIGCWEFIWISSNRQWGSLFGFLGNRQLGILLGFWVHCNWQLVFFGISTQSAIQLGI